MSKKDMEDLDGQILEVANRAGEARSAEETKQADQKAEYREKVRSFLATEEQKRQEKQMVEQEKMRRFLMMLVKALSCLIAAGVFLAMLLDPRFWAPVVGCVGIITFVVAGSICIDRYCRRR